MRSPLANVTLAPCPGQQRPWPTRASDTATGSGEGPPHSAYYPAFANKREQGDTDTEADRQGLRAGVGAVIGKGLRLFSG